MATETTSLEMDAKSIAAELGRRGVGPDERVRVFMLDPEDEFFKACARSR